MAETTIEHSDYSFNGWIGCEEASPGCRLCYAKTWGHRFKYKWGPNAPRIRTSASNWRQPLYWNAKARVTRRQARVLAYSLGDVFDAHASIPNEWRRDLFKLVKATPHLHWVTFTKRPWNWISMLEGIRPEDLPNMRLCCSIENMNTLDERIEALAIMHDIGWPTAVSAEPLLESLDFGDRHKVVDELYIGGESEQPGDRKATDLDPDNVRSLIVERRRLGLPVFVKQLGTGLAKKYSLEAAKGGNWDEWPADFADLKVRELAA